MRDETEDRLKQAEWILRHEQQLVSRQIEEYSMAALRATARQHANMCMAMDNGWEDTTTPTPTPDTPHAL